VIVSRRSGAAELVRAGENGWVCEAHDEIGLASLLAHAAASAQDEKMRAAARASAEGFGIDEMARKLTELYAALGRSRA